MEGVTTFSCLVFILGVSFVVVNAKDVSSRRLAVVLGLGVSAGRVVPSLSSCGAKCRVVTWWYGFTTAVVVELVRDEDAVEAFSSPSGSVVGAELLSLLAVVAKFILWLMTSIMLLTFDVSF